ncbi:NADP-dependent oxidoreductase [Kribbella speibonae]|uniref:NADP-dependent oxidoreductase n=1 Tax=Kribbella speibonae TaxID=1572660 RepID=A0A4R0I9K5_9ACTN|nr:NADP-dependent oxidoreductase [Kribbella speibonae]TCC28967.1 NADP-dependent oxidoreductase [Kribbella speibonae]
MPLGYGFTSYGGPEFQRFLDLPMPEPGPGELLVEVHSAGVNPVDWKVREGKHRAFLPLTLPAVLGREVSGTVIRAGAGFAAGDRVCGPTVGGCGGYAEFALLPAERVARMPTGLSFTDASVLPIAAGTAYDALETLHLEPGESLLILGAGGGVGTVAAQLAVMRGIEVAGTASATKHHYLQALGVVAYDHDQEPPRADAVLDLVGALDNVDGGRILSVADPEVLAHHGARPLKRNGDPGVLAVLTELVANGKLDPGVRHVYPFAEAGDALALVEAGHVAGKVVVGLPTGPRH